LVMKSNFQEQEINMEGSALNREDKRQKTMWKKGTERNIGIEQAPLNEIKSVKKEKKWERRKGNENESEGTKKKNMAWKWEL
jgi:hypothetical protein